MIKYSVDISVPIHCLTYKFAHETNINWIRYETKTIKLICLKKKILDYIGTLCYYEYLSICLNITLAIQTQVISDGISGNQLLHGYTN